MHAVILNGFPETVGSSDGRVLWRVDRAQHNVSLYVISPQRPDFSHIVEEGGWQTSPAGVADYQPFLERLQVGQRFVFRLRANTVRSTKARVASGGRGRRVNVGSRSLQEAWLLARAADLGFEIPDDPSDTRDERGVVVARRNLSLTARETLRFQRRTGEEPVSLATAQFDGLLRVSDPEKLRHALCSGVGPGRAYGCGLLTLAPLA